MGWVAVSAWGPMAAVYSPTGMWLLLSGGIAYTIGAILYLIGKKTKTRYMHSVFHIFCLIGSALHFISIALYVW